MKFLLELASEEIPARMQVAAAEQLRTRFVDGLKAAGLSHGDVVADATPRRLWLVADDVAAASAASVEERKGPAATAPEAAIAGFLRSTGLTREQLEERQTPKGVVLFAQIASPGRDAAAILAELVPAIVRDFQWPKSMRWGDASVSTASPRWVRPLTGIVAMLDGDVVPCEAHGIVAGKVTRGHRIHGGDALLIERPDTYAEQLRAAKVVVSSSERRGIIAEKAAIAAGRQGLSVVPDAGLVAENAGLTEWPVPMLGGFDPAFLSVPREVIQLTMRTNQKYFAVVDGSGALAPGFVCVANLEASDGGAAIVAGNERVLSARLSDAKFFWDQDVATVAAGGLEAFLPKLSDIVFHEKLGTVADKVERVAKLARWLVESGAVTSPFAGEVGLGRQPEPGEGALVAANPSPRSAAPSRPLPQGEREELASLAEQAARLCKADLVSATVGEFPEVQGIAGAYLARVAGLDARVADAIRNHYKPVGQGDDVPTAPVSVAVALADKLDTLVGFFAIDELPTGSRDPFALRRQAIGILATVQRNDLRFDFDAAASRAQQIIRLVAILAIRGEETPLIRNFGDPNHVIRLDGNEWSVTYGDKEVFRVAASPRPTSEVAGRLLERSSVAKDVTEFVVERLKVQQREAGTRHDLIDAVFSLGGEHDLTRLLARVKALQALIATDDGANLLAGYKRAANILTIEDGRDGRIHTYNSLNRGILSAPAEIALATALEAALPAAEKAVAAEDFFAAMTTLAALRQPVDSFFADLLVNDSDPAVRENRLALLSGFRVAVHEVADFSKIEG